MTDNDGSMAREATLTALELMRQAVVISPGYGDDMDHGVDAQQEAVYQYLQRYPDQLDAAVLMLANVLAYKATASKIMTLRAELGRMPSQEEIMTELDSDEWFELTGS